MLLNGLESQFSRETKTSTSSPCASVPFRSNLCRKPSLYQLIFHILKFLPVPANNVGFNTSFRSSIIYG